MHRFNKVVDSLRSLVKN